MVHAMHVGRDDDPAQHTVEPRRQAHIAVVEHRGGVEQHLEDQHRHGRRAEGGDDAELDTHRQQDLDRMEAHAGRHVELEVGVVHAVQPPQRRHRMEQHVLQVDGEIEQDDRGDDGKPGRRVQRVQESPAMFLGEQGHADGCRREDKSDKQRVEDDDADVARPALTASERLSPARGQQLPQRHSGKNPGKAC